MLLGNEQILKGYLGTSLIDKIHLGSTLVYTKSTEDFNLEDKFDHLFTAKTSLNDSSELITNDTPVNIIPDLIGNRDMTYIGAVDPTLTHSKPIYNSNLNGYIFLANETNVCYESESNITPEIMEHWHIGILADYLIYEAFFNVFNALYLGDQSFSAIRTRGGGEDENDTAWFAPVTFNKNQLFLIRRVLYRNEDSTNFVREELYFNGVKIDKELTTYKKIPNFTFALGAATNNSHWGWVLSAYKMNKLSDEDANAVTSKLMLDYGINEVINLPHVNDLRIDRTGTVYTASYTDFTTVNGIGIDVNNMSVRWVHLESGPTISYYMPELEGLMTFNSADYPQYDIDSKPIRVELIMPDLNGNKFSIPQSYLLSQ